MLRIISEKLEFDSSELLRESWRDAVREAQDKAGIIFDLENDDTVSAVRKMSFSNGSPPDAYRTKDDYYVQLCSAGGDWESPTYYFRIQVKEGYPSRKMFVYIPAKSEGNGLLTTDHQGQGYPKSTKYKYRPLDADNYDKDGRDEKKCWNAVEDFLKKHSKKSTDDKLTH